MPLDRTEINKKLAVENFFPPFFSVLLPELGRPQYVIRCVEQILKHADLPVEIIVHDDGSGKEKESELLEKLHTKVSTMVFNTGNNTGLGTSMDRCRKMANSKYLLALNVDSYVESGFLKSMKAALDLPYVGMVRVIPKVGGTRGSKGVYISDSGAKISLAKNAGDTLLFGIRSEVWDEVKGWDENVQSTSSDVGFSGNVFGKGYFTVAIEGEYCNEQWIIVKDDVVVERNTVNKDYISSARFAHGDNNLPKLPNLSYTRHRDACEKRREAIWFGVNTEIQDDVRDGKVCESWYNHIFLGQEVGKLFLKNGDIDWEFAKKYGHDKWKDMIIKDFNL